MCMAVAIFEISTLQVADTGGKSDCESSEYVALARHVQPHRTTRL